MEPLTNIEQAPGKVMPISSLSYSALTQLLRNPLIFKMKYILGVYDAKMSVSGMIGRAGHEALKTYYGGNLDIPVPADRTEAIALAKETGLQYLNEFDDGFIEYGKTGSREDMLKGYSQAMDFYFAEEPDYHEVLLCEEKLDGELRTMNGDILPLPASGIPDLVHKRKDGKIEIIDTKFVTRFTDYESEDYIKIIQSMFMYHLLLSAKGIEAERMLFREIKRTKNSNGDTGKSQIRDWAVPFDHEPYKIIFYNLYRDVAKFLANDPIFLPNLSDPFDGEHAGLMYAQGLINADMSDVEVMHKVRDIAFASKKFVASRLDRAENQHLLPEEKIKLKLLEFGIPVEPDETKNGGSVTQYRFRVSAGVRMQTIKKHKDDIAHAIGAKGEIRILAPIPGTSLVGVEVENEKREVPKLGKEHLKPGTLSLPIGVNVNDECVSIPLDAMPHLLIAGTTGSGKSTLLHNLITALTKQMTPEMLDLILIDPKRVELAPFARKPHVREKVIYEYGDALKMLLRISDEMERRYKLLERAGKRDIGEYNTSKRSPAARMDYIVVVVDEFADLILRAGIEEKKKKSGGYQHKSKPWLLKMLKKRGVSPGEGLTKAELAEALEELDAQDEMNRPDASIELLLVRLAQMARAVGIHLIIATQRPSTDVITGLIKANFPTRIALTTASPTDSEVILGKRGAEKLAGKGDMLFLHPANRGEIRLQGFAM